MLIFPRVLLGPCCGALTLAVGSSCVLQPAHAEVQLQCRGTLLEARGSAEQERPIARLRFSLALEAEGPSGTGALVVLQERLAAVRTALQALDVQELTVTSPSTWERPAELRRPPQSQAMLQVGGWLAPARLQPLIRQVGTLPGVRLAPVSPESDPARTAELRRSLLATAYRNAAARAGDVAAALGLSKLQPLEVQVEGEGGGPMPMPAPPVMGAKAEPPPFNPAELQRPKDFASMLVRFCAR